MTIIVKKPFEPDEGIKDINTKDINAANEQVHPEFEEKPIMATTQTSEETHGGSELTFSLPNSSQSNEQEQQQNGTSSPSNADTNNDNAADNSDNKGDQEQQNADGEKSNDNNETSDADRQSNGGGGNNTQEPQSTATDTNQSAQEQENANAESGEGNQNGEDGNGDNDTEDQGQDSNNDNESTNAEPGSSVDNGDGDTNGTNATDNDVPNQGRENDNDNEQNSENDGEDEESESEEQAQSGTYNTQQVVDVINAVSASSKYYQTEFYRFIELIAEEKSKIYDPMGSEEYNVKKLMFRQIERKPLSHYKMSRVRESVVILLDNSGSMRWWSDNLQILADLAMQRNDVEVYLAPNGHIEEMLYPKYQLVNHDDVMKRLRNRKIIYVGDFDGADTPIILSWYNDVIWICPEGRYLNFLDHDWVHYDESRFKGAFLRVFTLQEMFDAFKKLLSMPTLRFWYDLCNETHKCGGDEE